MNDGLERRYGRSDDAECQHVWRSAVRRWDIVGPIECSVVEDQSRAYTNDDDGLRREWAIYICALCDLREALEIPS